MELKLKKEALRYYEMINEPTFSFETTQEAIVPDYCPDVARVVSTDGMVFIHSRGISTEGRLEISGSIKASVLFVPDGAGGASVLHLQLPFRTYREEKGLEGCGRCGLRASLKSLEARLLNPRKLLLRAEISFEPTGYRAQTTELCTGLEERDSIQVLEEESLCSLLMEIIEKESTFTEELQIPAGRKGARELLEQQVTLMPTELKIVGRKLIVKGSIEAELLWRSQTDELSTLSQEYSFSQILETQVDEEQGLVQASFELSDCVFRIGSDQSPEDDYTITMELGIRTVAKVSERRALHCLADLYSLRGAVKLESQTVTLPENPGVHSRKYNLREIIETGVAARQIIRGQVRCGPVSCRLDGEKTMAQTSATLRVLYCDENGALLSAERDVPLSVDLELEKGDVAYVYAECDRAVQCLPVAEGVELRVPVNFRVETYSRRERLCIQEAVLEDDATETARPSVVLRRMAKGTRLWDIAKKYHSTCEDILTANGLEKEEDITDERLLLIPKRRA